MINLGVSVYPDISSIERIEEYLKLASKYGFTRVFSSMFSVKDTKENIITYFKKFIEIAHKYGMKVSLDVNPDFMEKLGVKPNDLSLFHEIGCDILRMDLSYGWEYDKQLIENPYGILIELNASMGLDIQEYIKHGVDTRKILTCHNFYPQRYTGVKWKDFTEINDSISKYNVRVGAFISSHAENTHGVWDAKYGLPTVEIHRDMPIDLQLRHMLATKKVTDVLIGNAYASEEEFKEIQRVLSIEAKENNSEFVESIKKVIADFGASQIVLKVDFEDAVTDVEKEIVLDFYPHVDLGDSSEWMIRSRLPRDTYSKIGVPARKSNKKYFTKGDIVIVNDTYAHYAGEVQIVLMDMENDGQRNLIGHLDENEQRLLEFITNKDVIVFLDKNSK